MKTSAKHFNLAVGP